MKLGSLKELAKALSCMEGIDKAINNDGLQELSKIFGADEIIKTAKSFDKKPTRSLGDIFATDDVIINEDNIMKGYDMISSKLPFFVNIVKDEKEYNKSLSKLAITGKIDDLLAGMIKQGDVEKATVYDEALKLNNNKEIAPEVFANFYVQVFNATVGECTKSDEEVIKKGAMEYIATKTTVDSASEIEIMR